MARNLKFSRLRRAPQARAQGTQPAPCLPGDVRIGPLNRNYSVFRIERGRIKTPVASSEVVTLQSADFGPQTFEKSPEIRVFRSFSTRTHGLANSLFSHRLSGTWGSNWTVPCGFLASPRAVLKCLYRGKCKNLLENNELLRLSFRIKRGLSPPRAVHCFPIDVGV